jgi:hypothetical protein
MHKTVVMSSFFSFSSTVPKAFMGSVRLRHNGSSDGDIRALILADDGGDDQSFTVPFVYPASALSASGTMQCAPLYYVGDSTSAMLALQNSTNNPVTATVTLQYGDGGLAGAAGNYQLPPVKLYAQQTALIDLSSYKSNLQGASWGSIAVSAPPQSVVAHAVMIDPPMGCAFDSAFTDPAMLTQTALTATGLSIDAMTGRMACLMVCNQSGSSRTVNVSYQTSNGISIPSTQVTLAAGQQKMIKLTPGQVLPGGGSTMADARISFSGSPGDIMAGGVSMSPTDSRAIPARFAEARPGDGRRLISPFFWFDERVTGVVQVSNLGSSTVKAGVEMMFDDMSLFPLNTDIVTIPAGATATLNLQNYFSVFDDGVTAQGCLQLVHNGTPGTVVASFISLGAFSSIGLSIPLQGGPSLGTRRWFCSPTRPGCSQAISLSSRRWLGCR